MDGSNVDRTNRSSFIVHRRTTMNGRHCGERKAYSKDFIGLRTFCQKRFSPNPEKTSKIFFNITDRQWRSPKFVSECSSLKGSPGALPLNFEEHFIHVG